MALKSFTKLLYVALFLVSARASPFQNIEARQSSLPAPWSAIGCYTDLTTSRTLRVASFTDVNNMTIESCLAFCTPAGYKFAGVEFARECYCDNVIESPGVPISSSSCNMPCTGNANEICGGSNAINVFETNIQSVPPPWSAIGCFTDVTTARTLRVASFTDVSNMTIESCLSFCTPAGYKFAGVEFARECYCDNVIESPGVPTSASSCNMACTGNSNEICGGAGAINVFQNTAIATSTTATPTTTPTVTVSPSSTTAAPTPTTTIKQSAGSFAYQGCYLDGVNGASRSLIHQLSVPGGVTIESCTAACKAGGFILAGVEFAQECWCDIYMPLAVKAPDTDCNMPCTADKTEFCGAGNRLSLYVDTSAPPLDLSICLDNAQLQAGNVPEFNFDLEARFIPSSSGAPVPTPVQLGNSPVPLASSNGLHLEILGPRVAGQGHTYTMGTDTIGQLEVMLSKNAQGIANGSAVVPVPGGPQFFDTGSFDNFPEEFMYCPQPNQFSPSTYIGPPLLGAFHNTSVWALCDAGLIYQPNSTSGTCTNVVIAMTQSI